MMRNSITCENIPLLFMDKLTAKIHFARFGKIKQFTLLPEKHSCVVEYERQEAAQQALKHGDTWRNIQFRIRRTELEPSSSVLKSSSVEESAPMSSLSREVVNYTELEPMNTSSGAPVEETNTYFGVTGIPSKVITTVTRNGKIIEARNELKRLVSRPAITAEERYQVLQARDRYIHLCLERTPNPENIKGTCEDMCPEKERYLREWKGMVPPYERQSDTSNGIFIEHAKAIKQHSRRSADEEVHLPHELRTEQALGRTMHYLLTNIVDKIDYERDADVAESFDYIWDRTRAIRRDIAQQDLCSKMGVELVEQCARFHIHCAAQLAAEEASLCDERINTENLTDCLQILKRMYATMAHRGQPCPCEPEFRAYLLLLYLNDGDFPQELQEMSITLIHTPEVKFALSVYIALTQNNYVAFFELVRATNYMNACIMHRYFTQVRENALTIMRKAYSSRTTTRFELAQLTRTLGFEDEDDAEGFFDHYGVGVNRARGFVVLEPTAVIYLPEFPYWTGPASMMVECKRSYSVGETICGTPLDRWGEQFLFTECVSSFDDEGHLRKQLLDEILEKDSIQTTSTCDEPCTSKTVASVQPASHAACPKKRPQRLTRRSLFATVIQNTFFTEEKRTNKASEFRQRAWNASRPTTNSGTDRNVGKKEDEPNQLKGTGQPKCDAIEAKKSAADGKHNVGFQDDIHFESISDDDSWEAQPENENVERQLTEQEENELLEECTDPAESEQMPIDLCDTSSDEDMGMMQDPTVSANVRQTEKKDEDEPQMDAKSPAVLRHANDVDMVVDDREARNEGNILDPGEPTNIVVPMQVDDGGIEDGGHDDGGIGDGGHDDGGYQDGGYEDGGHENGAHEDDGHEDGGHEDGGHEAENETLRVRTNSTVPLEDNDSSLDMFDSTNSSDYVQEVPDMTMYDSPSDSDTASVDSSAKIVDENREDQLLPTDPPTEQSVLQTAWASSTLSDVQPNSLPNPSIESTLDGSTSSRDPEAQVDENSESGEVTNMLAAVDQAVGDAVDEMLDIFTSEFVNQIAENESYWNYFIELSTARLLSELEDEMLYEVVENTIREELMKKEQARLKQHLLVKKYWHRWVCNVRATVRDRLLVQSLPATIINAHQACSERKLCDRFGTDEVIDLFAVLDSAVRGYGLPSVPLYWKLMISNPSNERFESFNGVVCSWLHRAFKKDQEYDQPDHQYLYFAARRSPPEAAICVRTTSDGGIGCEDDVVKKACDRMNGLLLIVHFNETVAQIRQRLQRLLSVATAPPAVAILQFCPSHLDPIEVDRKLELHEVTVCWKMFRWNRFDDNYPLRAAIIFLAKGYRDQLRVATDDPERLEMRSLIPFLNSTVGSELWFQLEQACSRESTTLKNGRLSQLASDGNAIIQMYNAALERVRHMITDEELPSFARLAEEFDPLRNRCEGRPIGVVSEPFFPSDWHSAQRRHQLEQLLDKVQLPALPGRLQESVDRMARKAMESARPVDSTEWRVQLKHYLSNYGRTNIANSAQCQKLVAELTKELVAQLNGSSYPEQTAHRAGAAMPRHCYWVPLLSAIAEAILRNAILTVKLPAEVCYRRSDLERYLKTGWGIHQQREVPKTTPTQPLAADVGPTTAIKPGTVHPVTSTSTRKRQVSPTLDSRESLEPKLAKEDTERQSAYDNQLQGE